MPQPTIHPSEIRIKDFQYPLPDDRIARFPLPIRDQSKLLIYKDGTISESIYRNLAEFIPHDSLMIFNEAKVIHARLFFHKQTGGAIEVFCLEPDHRYPDITTAMMQEGTVYWQCLLKGAHKWKGEEALTLEADFEDAKGTSKHIVCRAERVSREGHSFLLKLSWQLQDGTPMSFSEFLEYVGKIPIPPYLKRKAEASDDIRYQTIFAKEEGSVAAPTAALHFTPAILEDLKKQEVQIEKLTLHVGAGTFMPVKSEKMEGHVMHSEWIEISLRLLEHLAAQMQKGGKVITVGTTSARTLESLYWIGVQILRKEWDPHKEVTVDQWYPYQRPDEYSGLEAVKAVISYMKEEKLNRLITRTQLIIAPGYEFKLLDGLITNFHQPASTLLLMISALVGENWHQIYDYALAHDFRFLSYGDGSLLWR